MLEDILRRRDTDNELYRALGLKSLEVGLKIRMLETEAGGKTVEVWKCKRREGRDVKDCP